MLLNRWMKDKQNRFVKLVKIKKVITMFFKSRLIEFSSINLFMLCIFFTLTYVLQRYIPKYLERDVFRCYFLLFLFHGASVVYHIAVMRSFQSWINVRCLCRRRLTYNITNLRFILRHNLPQAEGIWPNKSICHLTFNIHAIVAL